MMRLDPASGRPLYQQVVDQVKHMVAAGTLRAGDRLPTVREMAADLIVNPNTIAHAYQQLEREKVIETRRGLGSFICATDSPLSRTARISMVTALIETAIVEAHHLSVSAADVRAILEERLAHLGRSEGKNDE